MDISRGAIAAWLTCPKDWAMLTLSGYCTGLMLLL